MRRALTLENILSYKAETLPLEGEWASFVGQPEIGSTWIIWGGSFSGKTRLAIKLQKCLAHYAKTAYNSLEEGLSESLKLAIVEENMHDVKRNYQLWDRLSIEQVKKKLRQKRSADVVIIDSLQYTGLTYSDYKTLREEFPKKTFIFISHAEGREPKGNVAKSIRYDASVKIYCEGYKAVPQSRFGGGSELVIWPSGHDEYWNLK